MGPYISFSMWSPVLGKYRSKKGPESSLVRDIALVHFHIENYINDIDFFFKVTLKWILEISRTSVTALEP